MKPPTLPKSVGVWTRPDTPTRVEPGGIFDYMDGAGELYLGYRFQHLDVYEYTSPAQGEILVELYSMESPDDAYGLLSGDWGGEVADLKASGYIAAQSGVQRALYGAGLLRIWCGNLFVRIVASQETAESKNTVYALGQAIVAGQPAPPPPALMRALPASVDSRFQLRTDRVVFLRSHLVLNSAYFLSSENLLDLGPKVEAVVASYVAGANGKKPARLLMLRYPDAGTAQSALAHFKKIYLAEKYKDKNLPGSALDGAPSVLKIEDGWMGYAQSGRGLALVFECPDEQSAGNLIKSAVQALERMEAAHE